MKLVQKPDFSPLQLSQRHAGCRMSTELRARSGLYTGACFTWHALNFSTTARERNGAWLIIHSVNVLIICSIPQD